MEPNLEKNTTSLINKFHRFWVKTGMNREQHAAVYHGDAVCPNRLLAMMFLFACDQEALDSGVDTNLFE